jgi:hypothetical protein
MSVPQPLTSRERIGAVLTADIPSRLSRFLYAELPPAEWSPKPPRSDIPDDDVSELIDNTSWIELANATPDQLRRALEFHLWQMGPELERAALLIAMVDRLPVEEVAA